MSPPRQRVVAISPAFGLNPPHLLDTHPSVPPAPVKSRGVSDLGVEQIEAEFERKQGRLVLQEAEHLSGGRRGDHEGAAMRVLQVGTESAACGAREGQVRARVFVLGEKAEVAQGLCGLCTDAKRTLAKDLERTICQSPVGLQRPGMCW